MKLKLILPALALMALPPAFQPAAAAPITYPGSPAADSSTGAAVTSGITATVASVTDLDGTAKASTLAAAHIAGGNTSAVYDAAANGEAWVTLTLTATGHTFAPVVIFCSVDPSTLASANTGISTANTGISANSALLTGNLDAKVSTRQPSGPVALQAGQSTVASNFAPAPTPAQNAAAIVFPAFPASFAASNLPADYQQRSVAVTLPSTAPSGYGGGTSGGTVTVGGYAAGQDPATLLAGSFAAVNSGITSVPAAILQRPLGHGMTVGQLLVLLQASNGPAAVTNTWNASTHTLTTAYQFPGDSAPVRSDATVYPSTQATAPPVQARATTIGTVPQP